MKKIGIIAICLLYLSGCSSPPSTNETTVQTITDSNSPKAIIPKYNISDSYYRTILPFEPGKSRGLIVSTIDNRLDINEFDSGLMELAQTAFPTDQYYFQQGKYLDSATLRSWLKRKKTDKQLADSKEKENVGLNPALLEGNVTEQNEKNPLYLGYIMEHDYYIKQDDGSIKLGGIVIGLGMNTVHNYNTEEGYPREVKLDTTQLKKQGELISSEIISRLRTMSGLEDIPIVMGLFYLQPKSSIVPGNFFSIGQVGKSKRNVDSWKAIDEKYYVFPSDIANKDHFEDAGKFKSFKSEIEQFFPNYTGIVGKAFYVNDEWQSLHVSINMQFFSKTEVIGFTQYITGLMMDQFPDGIQVEVEISSIRGQEALIVHEPQAEKPFVHVYMY